MAIRLIEMRRILKPIGSIYLHCDPTMGHYLKLMMDAIFGYMNFKNEIIWHYRKWCKRTDIVLNENRSEGNLAQFRGCALENLVSQTYC